MPRLELLREFIKEKAAEFGAKPNAEYNKPFIERNNTGPEAFRDQSAFFGFIHPEEEYSGPFHDFSLTIFPSPDDSKNPWLVCLGIGTNGFKNDFELANQPGVRRLFSQLVDENGYCKIDFSDIDTSLPKSFSKRDDLQHLNNALNKLYSKVLPVCQIVNDPESEQGKKIISAFVAGYAKLREWATNNQHRNSINAALSNFLIRDAKDDEEEIINLVLERRYLIIQGAPGTGKTRLAKLVAQKMGSKTFFTQFHAETTYSDFIYGIKPNIKKEVIAYEEYDGIFTRALKHAIENKGNTFLIIDEINRANLSNVLGPIFYLFEYKQDTSNALINITPSLQLDKLPDNFFVIATMNTADRSLAVVDFALRRRFAWYTLFPKLINTKHFFKDDFIKIKEIFEWYANSNELPLQPGQGYFISNSEQEMEKRIRYELLPLIKEYLLEGFLKNAKEEFNDYFTSRINMSIFE